jgi:phage gp36-like protein
MLYATTEELSGRLGATLYARLTDRVSGTTPSDTVAQQLLDAAEAEMHTYLASRYRTPIDLGMHAELAPTLKSRVLDIAEYLAWKGSPFMAGLPARVRDGYDEALLWLSRIARGEASLPASSPPASSTAESDVPRYSSATRKFTSEEFDGI